MHADDKPAFEAAMNKGVHSKQASTSLADKYIDINILMLVK